MGKGKVVSTIMLTNMQLKDSENFHVPRNSDGLKRFINFLV